MFKSSLFGSKNLFIEVLLQPKFHAKGRFLESDRDTAPTLDTFQFVGKDRNRLSDHAVGSDILALAPSLQDRRKGGSKGPRKAPQ